MRKIEKETLFIINDFREEEYSHCKKLIDIREKEIQKELEKELDFVVNKEQIESRIEIFKRGKKYKVEVNFDLSIRSYYTDYQFLYDNDPEIIEFNDKMKEIEVERNKMKLILQNSEIKSSEYQNVIKKLKGGKQ